MQRPENEPSAKLKRMKKALCNFYTLIQPVNAEDDILDIPEIMASLQDTTKYKKVRNMAVSKIAKKFNNDFLYLVIEDFSAEGMDEAEDEDDLGIFGDDKIVANLAEMDCKVAYVVFGHPNIAPIQSLTGGPLIGCLKFVRDGGNEIEILHYTTSLAWISRRTIPYAPFTPGPSLGAPS